MIRDKVKNNLRIETTYILTVNYMIWVGKGDQYYLRFLQNVREVPRPNFFSLVETIDIEDKVLPSKLYRPFDLINVIQTFNNVILHDISHSIF